MLADFDIEDAVYRCEFQQAEEKNVFDTHVYSTHTYDGGDNEYCGSIVAAAVYTAMYKIDEPWMARTLYMHFSDGTYRVNIPFAMNLFINCQDGDITTTELGREILKKIKRVK
jgi:hypothetical protein